MNVYDFDGTIYDGDSTCHFVRWLWLEYPKTLLNLPRTIWCGILYKLGMRRKEQFKQVLYGMFRYVPDMEEAVARFVDLHVGKIKNWYLKSQQHDDVVVTASPEFLVNEFCRRIGISRCIGSKVDKKTGALLGEICQGYQKLDRFYFCLYHRYGDLSKSPFDYKNPEVDKFYSDRLSDTPMAIVAREAFLVTGESITPWPGI